MFAPMQMLVVPDTLVGATEAGSTVTVMDVRVAEVQEVPAHERMT